MVQFYLCEVSGGTSDKTSEKWVPSQNCPNLYWPNIYKINRKFQTKLAKTLKSRLPWVHNRKLFFTDKLIKFLPQKVQAFLFF